MPSLSVEITLPQGSSATDVMGKSGIQQISGDVIDGLANGASSAEIVYTNPTGASVARVIIGLGLVQPTGSPTTVSITNNTGTYTISVSTVNSQKKIEFSNIPTSFLSSFTVVNNLGVSFPNTENTILIIPM